MKSHILSFMLVISLALQGRDLYDVAYDLEAQGAGAAAFISHNKAFLQPYDDITSLEGLSDIPSIDKAWVVDLRGNTIEVVDENTFNDPKFSAVRWLDLSGCNIKKIKPNAFRGLKNLWVLYLNDNQLEQFEPGTFNGVQPTWLTLGNNPKAERLKKQAQRMLPKTTIFTGKVTKEFMGKVAAGVGVLAIIVAAVLGIKAVMEEDKEQPIGVPESGRMARSPFVQIKKEKEPTERPTPSEIRRRLAAGEISTEPTKEAIARMRPEEPTEDPTLVEAAYLGDVEAVEKFIKAGANLDELDGNGETALSKATYAQNTEIVRMLLKAGANPNILNLDGTTPLIAAMMVDEGQKPSRQLVQLLLDHGAKPDAGEPLTAREVAEIYKHADILKMFGDVAPQTPTKTKSPLIGQEPSPEEAPTTLVAAISDENVGAVRKLIEEKADPNARENGATPLVAAALTGNTEIVSMLLDNKATIDQPDGGGNTALMAAVMMKKPDVVRLLVTRGATVDQKTIDLANGSPDIKFLLGLPQTSEESSE